MKNKILISVMVIVVLSLATLITLACYPPPPPTCSDLECGDILTEAGKTYNLCVDLLCPDDGLKFGADNIKLNGNGHTIENDDSGYEDDDDTGIDLNGQSGAIVVNLKVIKFELGIDATYANNYVVANNYLENDQNADSTGGSGQWDAELDCDFNIIGGCCSRIGNFWADYYGTGFSETCTDTTPAYGICDSPYSVPGGGVDNYPLTFTDLDGDGVQYCRDKCPDTVLPESVPTHFLKPCFFGLCFFAEVDGDAIFEKNIGTYSSPNIIDSQYDLVDTHGCSCEQILDCKPGENYLEYMYGCTRYTMNVWIAQRRWWTTACQQDEDACDHDSDDDGTYDCDDDDDDNDGTPDCDDDDDDNDGTSDECECGYKVYKGGEDKLWYENTDDDWKLDIIDPNNDNDDYDDEEDIEPDSNPTSPDQVFGHGTPDWWCRRHPGGCDD